MTTDELSGQERTDLEITVCTNGVVNVHNPESDRAHSVMLDAEGDAVRCSCKGHRFNGHCYHTEEVEARPLVVTSATATGMNTGATTNRAVATDGGVVVETDEDGDTDTQPQIDHWGNAVEHYDEGVFGGGESCQCQSCGSRFEVALVAATTDTSSTRWEEFYECQNCGATGSFRFDGRREDAQPRRTWTGMIDYPEETR